MRFHAKFYGADKQRNKCLWFSAFFVCSGILDNGRQTNLCLDIYSFLIRLSWSRPYPSTSSVQKCPWMFTGHVHILIKALYIAVVSRTDHNTWYFLCRLHYIWALEITRRLVSSSAVVNYNLENIYDTIKIFSFGCAYVKFCGQDMLLIVFQWHFSFVSNS